MGSQYSKKEMKESPQTPKHWRHVTLVETTSGFTVLLSFTYSTIGALSLKAAGFASDRQTKDLPLAEAIWFGNRFDAWICEQEAGNHAHRKLKRGAKSV